MAETDTIPNPEPSVPDGGPRFIRSLRLTNLLSFGPAGEEIELRSLNVLVGANGSGKTNFVEALAVLAACPVDIADVFRSGGGIRYWFNNLYSDDELIIQAEVEGSSEVSIQTHEVTIGEVSQRAKIQYEKILTIYTERQVWMRLDNYEYEDDFATYRPDHDTEVLIGDEVSSRQSVLAQLKDPKSFPVISHFQDIYRSIRLYRGWRFGPQSLLRKPQASDLLNDYLAEDYGNLFLILNRMEFEPEAKADYLERLRDFLPDVTDYKLQIVGGTILMFLMEGRNAVPATRLSDGTLRWLCLLAILVAPSPPGVIVLEEPELGLHPDMINTLADMLKKAATRHQLVVTTHSDILIDALSDVPEAVMVVEKGEEGTTVRRLDAETLTPWLEEYRLGRLWMKGQIGGTRW